VVLAIEAGDDKILGVRGSSVLRTSVTALKQAIAHGSLSMERIDESVARIVALKIQNILWPSTPMI
jgi:beta-glucosidase-like glycosyl hydrolase